MIIKQNLYSDAYWEKYRIYYMADDYYDDVVYDEATDSYKDKSVAIKTPVLECIADTLEEAEEYILSDRKKSIENAKKREYEKCTLGQTWIEKGRSEVVKEFPEETIELKKQA